MAALTVLYDVEWQKMRVSFLNVNHRSGGFTTLAGTDDNLTRLDQYIYAVPTDSVEFALRVWRGLNLLNATRMGLSGQGFANGEIDNAVKVYRDGLQNLYNPHVIVQASRDWNWDKVLQDLYTCYREEPYWFKAIYDDLKRRKNVTSKKRQGDLSNRPDLLKFLSLMEQVRIGGTG